MSAPYFSAFKQVDEVLSKWLSYRVQAGKALDLPVYFGDAGSPAVLHSVGAERASCAVITLDTPGANYRSVWAMHKHFPGIKTYVRAHDVNHGINLEKAGVSGNGGVLGLLCC